MSPKLALADPQINSQPGPQFPAPPAALAPPLLTIAIPTFNRAAQLQTLLDVLLPQLAHRPQIELFLSDNASTDGTPTVIARAAEQFALAGARLRAHRHPQNLGADANFAFCFLHAAGHFFWLCGDDDLIVPDAVAQVLELLQTPTGQPAQDLDLLYATSYGYRHDFLAERSPDPLGRHVHTLHNPRTVSLVVNIMFTFISGIVVNRDRLCQLTRDANNAPNHTPTNNGASALHEASTQHSASTNGSHAAQASQNQQHPIEPPENFIGTNLVQLAWSLPLLLHHRRSAVLWTRPVAARVGVAHGYSLGRVFGPQLAQVLARLLPNRPDLAAPILNVALRRWLPSVAVEFRAHPNDRLHLAQAHHELRAVFGHNPRYWLFTYPALTLPLPAARLYTRLTALANKLLYITQLPNFWRKNT